MNTRLNREIIMLSHGCHCQNRIGETGMNNAEAVNWLINITADIGKIEHQDLWHYEQALSEIREMLEDTPTIEPEPKWIPCSERLPEEDGQYLITVKYKHVDGYNDIYAEHGEWYDEKWDMFCFGHCGEVEGILAWMPLPEPYKGG